MDQAPWLTLFRDASRGRRILYVGAGGPGVFDRLIELEGSETVLWGSDPTSLTTSPIRSVEVPEGLFDVILVGASAPEHVRAALPSLRSESGFEARILSSNETSDGAALVIRVTPFQALAFVSERAFDHEANAEASIRLDTSLAPQTPPEADRIALYGVPPPLVDRALVEVSTVSPGVQAELVRAARQARVQEAKALELLERLRPLRRKIEARLVEAPRPRTAPNDLAGTLIALETNRVDLESRLSELESELVAEQRRRRDLEEQLGETLRPRVSSDAERRLAQKDAAIAERDGAIADLTARLSLAEGALRSRSDDVALESSRRRAAQLEAVLSDREQRIFELEREREAQQMLRHALGSEQRDASAKLREMQRKLETLALERAAEASAAATRIEDLAGQLARAKRDLDEHETSGRQLALRLGQERQRSAELEHNLESLQERVAIGQRALEQQRSDLELEREAARKARRDLDVFLAHRPAGELAARGAMDLLTQEVAALRERLQSTARDRETLVMASSALVADRDALLDSIRNLLSGESDLQKLAFALDDSEKRLSSLVQQVEQILLGLGKAASDQAQGAWILQRQASAEVRSAANAVDERVTSVQTLKARLGELDQKLESVHAALSETARHMETMPATATDQPTPGLTHDLERLRKRIDELSNELHARDLEVATLMAERSKFEAQRTEALGAATIAEGERVAAKAELTRMQFQSQMREKALRTAAADARSMRTRIQELEAKPKGPAPEEVEAKLKDAREAKDRADQALAATLRHTAEQAEKSQRAIGALERAAEWTEELSRAMGTGGGLGPKVDELLSTVTSLSQEVKRLAAAKSPIYEVALAEHATAERLLALVSQLVRAQTESNTESLEAELQESREEAASLRAKLEEAFRELEAARERAGSVEQAVAEGKGEGPGDAALRAQLAEARAELNSVNQAFIALRDEAKVAAAALEEAHRNRDELARRLVLGAGLPHPVSELAAQNLALEAALRERDAALKAVSLRYRELARRLLEASARIERLERSASAAVALKRQLDAERAHRGVLEDRIRQLSEHLEVAERRVEQFQAEPPEQDDTDARLLEIEARLRAIEAKVS